jgi:hypothetical protein
VADNKSLPTHATELWELVLAYLKQETIGPLKELGRFVKFGVMGAVMLMIGLPLLALALLRAVQAETAEHLTGNLTWVTYLLAALLCAVFAGLGVFGMSRNNARRNRRKESR